jgi:hypothetical protein
VGLVSQTVPVFTGVVPNPYPQYTTCVEAPNYNNWNQYLQAGIPAVFAGAIAFAAAASAAMPWCYLAALAVTGSVFGLVFCSWWLTDRLICLPADPTATTGPAVDVCAVGMFVNPDQEEPSVIPYNLPKLDTDWTMNIVLYGTEPSDSTVNVLLAEDEAITNRSLSFNGHTASYVLNGVFDGSTEAYMNNGVTITSPVLHCEVEGAGIADYQKWLQVTLAAAIGALVAQAVVSLIPVIGPIIAAILALLAWLLSLLGFYASENDQASQPQGPGDQPLPLTPPGTASGAPASVVGVIGTWVYDSVHDGWNEIHPVKSIQAVGTMAPSLDGYPWDPSWAGWCDMMNQASSGPTRQTQLQHSNGWIIHPVVDGCGTYPAPPVTQQTQ